MARGGGRGGEGEWWGGDSHQRHREFGVGDWVGTGLGEHGGRRWRCRGEAVGCGSGGTKGVGESGGRARSSPSLWSVETITSAELGGQLRKIFQADFFFLVRTRMCVYLNTRALKTLNKCKCTFKKTLCKRKT